MGNSSSSRSPLGRVPWVPDKEFSRCMECREQFHAIRRRHHCRGCGRLLCGKCSSRRILMAWFLKYKSKVRACESCFTEQLSLQVPIDRLKVALLALDESRLKYVELNGDKFVESNFPELEAVVRIFDKEILPHAVVFTNKQVYLWAIVSLHARFHSIREAMHVLYKIHRFAPKPNASQSSRASFTIWNEMSARKVSDLRPYLDKFVCTIPSVLRDSVAPVDVDFDKDCASFTAMLELFETNRDFINDTTVAAEGLTMNLDTLLSMSLSYDTLNRIPEDKDFEQWFEDQSPNR